LKVNGPEDILWANVRIGPIDTCYENACSCNWRTSSYCSKNSAVCL